MRPRPFSLLIKPSSADCNLNCEYCFYLDRSTLYPSSKYHRMNQTVLEQMICSYMQTEQPVYSFTWQGGEPTLMGLDFFNHAIILQNISSKPGTSITNGLQTNATFIDDTWAAFFARHRFLIGVSLDGTKHFHDKYRRYKNGQGSYTNVLSGIKCLQNQKVEFNILTLVSQANVSSPLDTYRYLRDDVKCFFHQYIECVEFDSHNTLMPYAIHGNQWGDFLCTIFDEWARYDTQSVSIRLFDSILSMMVDNTPTLCSSGNDCRQYFVVEHNGDVYPCDFYVEKGRKLGNVSEASWSKRLASISYESFGKQKRNWHEQCVICPYLKYCAGDCPKNRSSEDCTTLGAKSILCDGWKQFYSHTLPTFEKLAEEIKKRRKQVNRAPKPAIRIGRNELCLCGSGKKYKKCCIK